MLVNHIYQKIYVANIKRKLATKASFVLLISLLYAAPALAAYTYYWPVFYNAQWGPAYASNGLLLRTVTYNVAHNLVPTELDPRGTSLGYYMQGTSVLNLAGQVFNKYTYAVFGESAATPAMTSSMSLYQASNLLTAAYPAGSTFSTSMGVSTIPDYVCSGISISSGGTAGIQWDLFANSSFFGPGTADQACVNPPPNPDEYCYLDTPSITLDYGTLTVEAAKLTTRSENVTVQCTSDMKYAISLPGNTSSLLLSNGMIAEITSNGVPLGSTLNGLANGNIVNISSHLTGTPDSTGAFSGTSILSIAYP